MKEIAERLQESRQIELAKSILESNGYKVSKFNEAEETISSEESQIDKRGRESKARVESALNDISDFQDSLGKIGFQSRASKNSVVYICKDFNTSVGRKLNAILKSAGFIAGKSHNAYSPEYGTHRVSDYTHEDHRGLRLMKSISATNSECSLVFIA